LTFKTRLATIVALAVAASLVVVGLGTLAPSATTTATGTASTAATASATDASSSVKGPAPKAAGAPKPRAESTIASPTSTARKHPLNRVNAGDDMIIIPGVNADVPTRKTVASGSSKLHTESASASTTVEEVYVSVAAVTSSTSDDVNTITRSSVQSMISALNSYWSAQSEGAVTIELAGYETRSLNESSCVPDTVLNDEESQAFGGQFADDSWIGTNTHLMVLTQESCGTTAFATVGGSGGEIFSGNGTGSSEGIPYLLHEFGHNLGFEHADASICTSTKNYDDPIADFSFTSSVCPTTEYDDYLDIMGYTVKDATPNISSPQQILSGWLTDYSTLDGSTPVNTVDLSPLGSASGTRAIKIVDPVGGDTYYVEYRAPVGRDATSAEFNYGEQCDSSVHSYTICELGSSSNGIVRILRSLPFPEAGANGTTVLATGLLSGSTDKTKRHTRLNTSSVFTNYDDDFTVTVNSLSVSNGASVTVSFAHPTATTSTNLTLSTNGQTFGSTSVATADASVTNSDGTTAAGTVAFYDGSTNLGLTTVDGSGDASFALPATLAGGSHAITARFTPSSPDDYSGSTSSAATLTVSKASSSVATNFGSKAAHPGARQSIMVLVNVAGVGTATGEVDVYANGVKVAKAMLTAGDGGSIGIDLPAYKRRGTENLTVSYLGNSSISGSNAIPITAVIR
jgi:hypothetical protein